MTKTRSNVAVSCLICLLSSISALSLYPSQQTMNLHADPAGGSASYSSVEEAKNVSDSDDNSNGESSRIPTQIMGASFVL